MIPISNGIWFNLSNFLHLALLHPFGKHAVVKSLTCHHSGRPHNCQALQMESTLLRGSRSRLCEAPCYDHLKNNSSKTNNMGLPFFTTSMIKRSSFRVYSGSLMIASVKQVLWSIRHLCPFGMPLSVNHISYYINICSYDSQWFSNAEKNHQQLPAYQAIAPLQLSNQPTNPIPTFSNSHVTSMRSSNGWPRCCPALKWALHSALDFWHKKQWEWLDTIRQNG